MSDNPYLPAKGAAVVAGVEAVIEWLTPWRPSRHVVVPEVVGLGTRAALLATAKAGVKSTVRRVVEHPAAVEGIVVAQDPAPGERVRRGSTVTLEVQHPEGH